MFLNIYNFILKMWLRILPDTLSNFENQSFKPLGCTDIEIKIISHFFQLNFFIFHSPKKFTKLFFLGSLQKKITATLAGFFYWNKTKVEVSITYIFSYNICLSFFVCPIITHEPRDRLASNFDWGTRENHHWDLSWVGTLL